MPDSTRTLSLNHQSGWTLMEALERSLSAAAAPLWSRVREQDRIEYVRHWDVSNPSIFYWAPSDEAIEAAKLIYQPFWDRFLKGDYVAFAHPEKLTAPQLQIQPHIWNQISVIRLYASEISDGRYPRDNESVFVGVRVAPRGIPSTIRNESERKARLSPVQRTASRNKLLERLSDYMRDPKSHNTVREKLRERCADIPHAVRDFDWAYAEAKKKSTTHESHNRTGPVSEG